MKCLVYIALIAFLGTVAVHGYDIRINPHRSPRGLQDEPHNGDHGVPHRPHHGQPLSAPDSKSEDERASWDHSGYDDDSYGQSLWDSNDDDRSQPPSRDRDGDSDNHGPDEFFDDSHWHHDFHRKRPPKRPPKWTTKKPRRKLTTTQSPTPLTTPLHITPDTNPTLRTKSTATTPSYAANPRPTPTNIATTRSMTTLIPEPTTARPKHCITRGPMRTTGPTPRSTESMGSITTRTPWNLNTPTEAATHWDTSTSSPEPTINTGVQEKLTLSPEVRSCIGNCISTPEHNPVCGSNNETYENEEKLLCAQTCGVAVTLRRRSLCPPPPFDGGGGGFRPPTRPPTTATSPSVLFTTIFTRFQRCMRQCPITSPIEFVCGSDLITYMNMDRLECARSCGKVVEILCDKPCAACGFNPVTPKTTTFATPTTDNVGRSSLEPDIKKCIAACPTTSEYNPVCGTNHVTYSNPGHLICAQFCGVVVEILCDTPCALCGFTTVTPKATTFAPLTTDNVGRSTLEPDIKECIGACPTTSEYNPVCGTDHVTYSNPGHLICAQVCGVAVNLSRFSPCSLNTNHTGGSPPSTTVSPGVLDCIRRCPLSADYNPVCGTDNLTYNNIDHLHCARYCGIDVEMQINTRCLDDFGVPPDDSTPSPTTANINRNKDEVTTASRSTATTTKNLTTLSTIQVTTPSTTQATTRSTTQETTPVPTLTTTSTPVLTTTIGFTIPPDILNKIYGSTTTKPTSTIKTTTKDSDEDVDLDARFGSPSEGSIDDNKIIFPE